MSKKISFEEEEGSDMESDVDNMVSDDEDEDGQKPKVVLKKVSSVDEGSDDEGSDEDIDSGSDMDDDDVYDFPSSTASEMRKDEDNKRKPREEEEEIQGMYQSDDEEEEEDDDDDYDENYLQKFDESLQKNVIAEHHPELISHNYEEVEALCRVVRDEDGIIMDPLHKTMPFITKYEKTKLLGERAKQINAGAQPTVVVDENIIDGYLIALKEYENKSIPMIIRRPLPSGGCEYWRLTDLELIV
jgi:DNA-directed RNA polymerase subunit K/omega